MPYKSDAQRRAVWAKRNEEEKKKKTKKKGKYFNKEAIAFKMPFAWKPSDVMKVPGFQASEVNAFKPLGDKISKQFLSTTKKSKGVTMPKNFNPKASNQTWPTK